MATLAGCLLLLPASTRTQSLSELYRPLMVDPAVRAVPPFRCGTAHFNVGGSVGDPGDPTRAATADMELPDGHPLFATQFPRFLRPTHNRRFGFRNFLVLGDHPTVEFERWHPETAGYISETWRRTATRAIGGRLVSVFNPVWRARTLRYGRWWGVDRPFLWWGRFAVPVPGSASEPEYVGISLAVAPPNVGPSAVVRVNDRVQYTSNVVNIRGSNFGNLLVRDTLDLAAVTRQFYEHFADEYEVIAIVSEATHIVDYGGFHRPVQNRIRGIGLELFDDSGRYGSAGALEGVEGYPGPGHWAANEIMLHEQGHQWGEYSAVWGSLRSPLDRKGHQPQFHTPLLFPGAVSYGAVLPGENRVKRGRRDGRNVFEIEATLPLVTYHPLTLYRMGLISASAVPRVLVFRNQGQFDERTGNVGVNVRGRTHPVMVNDLLAADGIRRGPTARRVRRAIVYVSRNRLAPKADMDVLNYFARRLGTSSGVTSLFRFPSFHEATGGRATMTTRIRPKSGPPAPLGPPGRCARIGRRGLVGFVLDREIGGCVAAGATIRVSGRLTLTDRNDYNAVCLNFSRYPHNENDDIYKCAGLDRSNRFEIDVKLPAGKPGGYAVSAFAFWPGSGGRYAMSTYTGAVEARGR